MRLRAPRYDPTGRVQGSPFRVILIKVQGFRVQRFWVEQRTAEPLNLEPLLIYSKSSVIQR